MPTSSATPPGTSSPGSTAALRTANQRRIIRVLQDHTSPDDGITQAEIARATSLAPATVSTIVRELAGARLVDTVAGSGRRGTSVRISRNAGLVAGVEFGRTHLGVAVADLNGTVLTETTHPLAPTHSSDEGLSLAEQLLDQQLHEVEAGLEDVLSIGLGLPAPIAPDGLVRLPAILPGWVGVHAQRVAEDRLGRPIHIDNDANLGALAEFRRGASRGSPCSAFVKISSGVGAGLLIDGRLFRGGAGTAGELGHLTVDERGPICRCGSRGCLEAYVSATHVLEQLAEQLPGATFAEVVDAAHDGNQAAVRMFEDVGHHLGWGLAIMANLLNPTTIVIGGEMSRAGDLLIEPAVVGMRRHALGTVAAETRVVAAALGERASLVGALLLALDRTDITLPSGVS